MTVPFIAQGSESEIRHGLTSGSLLPAEPGRKNSGVERRLPPLVRFLLSGTHRALLRVDPSRAEHAGGPIVEAGRHTIRARRRGATFPGGVCELPALLADFNQLAPTLARWAHRRGTYLLVHPVWPAMHYWNQLQKATRRWWALPTADVCLRDESGRAAPPWQMRATVLDFGAKALRATP